MGKETVIGSLFWVRKHLGREEILAQLAEECCELGQAALKLRRAMGRHNPTPVSEEEAMASLKEELGDVMGCLLAFGDLAGLHTTVETLVSPEKLERWARRLEGRHGGN